MARFADIVRGTRARKTIRLPIAGAKADPSEELGWDGRTVEIDVRPLRPDEDARVLEGALAFAKARGASDAGRGEPLYELGMALHSLLHGCVETESPTNAPRPFFDSVEQILGSEDLTRDHVAYLFQHIEAWQVECAPRLVKLTPEQFADTVARAAGGDIDPFVQLRPGAQWNFLRTLASLHLTSLERRLPSGSGSDPAQAS